MNLDLTKGSIMKNLLKFAFPIMIGNMLQQLYNIVDTLIVGRYLGENALAAVGSAYTLMVFVTSIIIGLCMGSSAFFSMQFGAKSFDRLEKGLFLAFVTIGAVSVFLNVLVYAGMDGIFFFMRVPHEIVPLMKEYFMWIFAGIMAVFLYNFVANLLRAVGNSIVPLCFLGASALLNIALDILFIRGFGWGVSGAAAATAVSQYLAGIGILLYCFARYPNLKVKKENRRFDKEILKELTGLSALTCVQQSIMNFGILMVQGLVNSFGAVVMAAFAAAVKIDSFAYAPVQDFGNAFSTYVAQNYGAGRQDRIRKGMRDAVVSVFIFCLIITVLVCVFARQLMCLFIDRESMETIAAGVGYLHIEAAFYCGIGLLFLFYGYYRAVNKPGVSVILTVVSLGTRVVLAYLLSAIPALGVTGIWMAVPIGWALADLTGTWYYITGRRINAAD
ncbi:MAG: MATE family efflux transporter [Bacillus sp. (in: Bacteria)]|nr:MATE family efflux transporter [Bacillus sp. (in: firmicutes)]MCM1425761.1 MATE family efflux transporter [Eubacterium sp.]